ncbi:MAG: hypothetical protein V1678_03135, partial [Candidatus Aenigmatarchaeota archaeon]
PFDPAIGDKIRMTLGVKKIFITDRQYSYTYNVGTDSASLLELVIDKYGLDDLESRVILVMDPITFCK